MLFLEQSVYVGVLVWARRVDEAISGTGAVVKSKYEEIDRRSAHRISGHRIRASRTSHWRSIWPSKCCVTEVQISQVNSRHRN
jgi:hypothetical protein